MIRGVLREVEADKGTESSKKISRMKRKNIPSIMIIRSSRLQVPMNNLHRRSKNSLRKLHSKYVHAIWISLAR